MYLNATMTAQEALALGFVTEVFPHSQLEAKAFALVKQYAKLPVQVRFFILFYSVDEFLPDERAFRSEVL